MEYNSTNTGYCSSGNIGGRSRLEQGLYLSPRNREAHHVQTSAQSVRAADRCLTVRAAQG